MAADPLINPNDMFGHGFLFDFSHMLLPLSKLRLDHCVCIPAISSVQFLVYRLLLLFSRGRKEPFLRRGLGYCSSMGHILFCLSACFLCGF